MFINRNIRSPSNPRATSPPTQRSTGTTLVELVLALALIGILTTVALPRARALINGIDVRGAANDADALYATARRHAIAHAVATTVAITPATGTLTVVAGNDTIATRSEAVAHGVTTTASRTSTTYGPTGTGLGVSNLTLVFSKSPAVETLTVSRLGRVRRQ